MSLEIVNRFKTVDFLISTKSTGTPTQLARRLSISERNLYNFLNLMRHLGCPIRYSRYRQTYYYTEPGSFSIHFNKFSEFRPGSSEDFEGDVFRKLLEHMPHLNN